MWDGTIRMAMEAPSVVVRGARRRTSGLLDLRETNDTGAAGLGELGTTEVVHRPASPAEKEIDEGTTVGFRGGHRVGNLGQGPRSERGKRKA